jgi:glyoxylase-like metal-dependent hydrolase (beta-lactamase superfamily II)
MDTGLLTDQSAVRVLELGDVRLTYVVDGAMELTTDGFFPDVPAEHWAAHPETLTASGRVAMTAGGLLVERDGRKLLIDAGLGEVQADVGFGFMHSGSMLETLAALGHDPADIEVLAFTHLHVDHTGWGFVRDEGEAPRKTFPNARYLLADEEWGPYLRGEVGMGAPSREEFIEPLAAEHTLITGGDEIFPGVHALVTPGHSPGHTSYLVSADDGSRILVFGDGFHMPAQIVHPDWPSGPDVDHHAVGVARERLLAELETPGTLGFAFHFGDQAFGRVTRDESGGRAWTPVPSEVLFDSPRRIG